VALIIRQKRNTAAKEEELIMREVPSGWRAQVEYADLALAGLDVINAHEARSKTICGV